MRDLFNVTMAGRALFISMNGSFELNGVDRVVTDKTIVILDSLERKRHKRSRGQEQSERPDQKKDLLHGINFTRAGGKKIHRGIPGA